MKVILGSSGIDSNLFTAHSTRAACISEAKVKDLTLGGILKRGNWPNNSTKTIPQQRKHYHRFVLNESSKFQKTIRLSLL